MTTRIAAAAVLAVALLALWAWALGQGNAGEARPRAPERGGAAALEQQIAELRAELDEARAERRALSRALERLRAETEGSAPTRDARVDEAVAAVDTEPAEAATSDGEQSATPSTTGVFDEERLLAHELPTGDVARLREIFESAQMEELYLRDRATREGWINKPRFQRALARLRGRLRDSLSDDEYDLILYATGEKNRVVLAHLLHGSPAMDAGLKDGDVVLRYNDVRIFQPRELQQATSSSPPGQLTPMVVLRDGEELRVFLPAGPVGVQLEAKTMPPLR